MKIHKRYLVGILFSFLLVVVIVALRQSTAFAASPFDGVKFFKSGNNIIMTLQNGTDIPFIDSSLGDNKHIYKANSADKVFGDYVFCDDSTTGNQSANSNSGITFAQTPTATSSGSITVHYTATKDNFCNVGEWSTFTANLTLALPGSQCNPATDSDCICDTSTGTQICVSTSASSTAAKGDACTSGGDCGPDGTCQKDGGDCVAAGAGGASGTTCESNSGGWPLIWLFCPLLDAASSGTTALEGLFEDQLSFSVSQLGDVNNANSGAFKVHKSWALVRDISTAMIVIVALVMILSQAASFGPFDAYTVRKMLPRIVAAVILIQISWEGVRFSINVVNDIARGLANLMYYPFGGPDQMGLFALFANAHLGTFELATFNWAAILVGAFLGVAFLFTMLGLALTAVLALLVAVFVLIFRKILIILLLIFAPLALLAWILPGTERYWKMWRDNLVKVLFMFPIAVAIIAAGRIFANVAGSTYGGSAVDQGNFVDLLFVLVGFFGPLFILPKTFKWGGQAMSLAGGAISTAGTKVGAKPKAFLGTRQEGWSAERKRRSQERYTHDVGFNWKRPHQRPLDLIRSGQIDPTLTGRRKRQATTAYSVAGHESEETDIKSANTLALMMIERTHPDEQDNYAQALAAGQKLKVDHDGRIMAERRVKGDIYIDSKGNRRTAEGGELKVNADGTIDGAIDAQNVKGDRLQRRAGLDQAARLGGDGNIAFVQKQFETAIASHDPKEIEMMNQFTTANVQTLFSKLPHIYKNNNYADDQHPTDFQNVARTVQGLNPNDITSLSGPGMETIRNNLIGRARTGDVESQNAIRRLTSVFNQTTLDPSLKGRIPSSVAKAMADLADPTKALVDPTEAKAWGIDTTLADIATRVDQDGVVS